MENKTLHLLILEDNPDDAELAVKELEREGFTVKWERVETEKAFIKALAKKPDLIFADYSLPSYDGVAALRIRQKTMPEIPLIMVSGTIGENVAVECMKFGATDYVLKSNFSRLGSVVKRALKETEAYRERKQAVEALRESEEKYRNIFENSVEGIYESTPEGRFSRVNLAFSKMLGYASPEELVSNISDIAEQYYVNPEDRRRFQQLLQKAGSVNNFEFKVRRKDSSQIWVSNSTRAYFNEDGKVVRYEGIVKNISKRKQAEEALRESEKKHRLLAENTVDCIWQMNLDMEFTYINQAILPFLGYTPKEWIGSKLSEHCSSEEIEKMQAKILDVLANLTDKTTEVFETSLYHKNGKEIPCEVSGKIVLDDAGNPIYLQGTTRDITERKKAIKILQDSEKKLTQAIQGNSIPTYIIDKNHIVTHWNKACDMLTGFSEPEMVGTKKHWMAFYPEERPVLADFIVNGATEEEMGGYYEEKIHKSVLIEEAYEGESFYPDLGEKGKWLFFSAAPLRDHAGNIIGAIQTFQDITERKNTEAQLRQAQKMEAIGTLTGGIAHDFNNLLTTILGNAQLALMDFIKDDSLREKIEEIKTAGNRATSLIRQLLAFSRKQVIMPTVMNINEVLNETERMLKRMIGEDVELSTVLKPELGNVNADSGQIVQIIMNLAVNARDTMPQGGKLTIETTNADLNENYFREHSIEGEKPGHYVMLAVSDTGIGMDKETQEHIFEPFFTTKEIGKGTGLGLSTVYGIVKQNNGFIWVYSEPGQGSTFKIYLPKVEGDAEPGEKERTHVVELGGSETVLIVEDDDSLRKLAGTVLKQKGYKVLEAENGEDALRISKEHEGQIDLMVTDVVMPKMGGRKVAEQLQPLYSKMKVIYMSGYTDNAIVHHGVLVPGLNFLEKPFTPEGLVRKVREVLDK